MFLFCCGLSTGVFVVSMFPSSPLYNYMYFLYRIDFDVALSLDCCGVMIGKLPGSLWSNWIMVLYIQILTVKLCTSFGSISAVIVC